MVLWWICVALVVLVVGLVAMSVKKRVSFPSTFDHIPRIKGIVLPSLFI